MGRVGSLAVVGSGIIAVASAVAQVPGGAADGTEVISRAAGDLLESCALELMPSRPSTPSSACTGCHDGSRATDAAHRGHGFDIPYDPSPRSGLRQNPEQFNPKIVLPGGQITCLTCHDPGSTLERHLAAPTSGDVAQRLCVACHVFD